ncbi:hypothetical protein PAXINDRAFT_169945 [Paxillus involutus ATCC 200175]|uniref:Uncharacterized protein n=1 Tax=Paxillus involutus ATCC 200175 TaxID=664439 RepID=A0A0C9TVB4_PAXIN|nr:hypothetical protein PAXINDRAFT_169945 [Paxillus involutus ATCC 200175]
MVTSYPKYQPAQDHVAALARAPQHQPRVDHHSEILQALTDSAHDLLAENALYKEIETLSKATLTIDKAFYDIGQKLSQATKEQNKRIELYKTCHDLETRWKQHHETYKQLLWRSREVAGKAQFAVDDFLKVFLPCLRDPSTTVPERQQLAQEHIKELEDKSKTSQNLSQEFLDFVGTLEAYIADFSRTVESLGHSERTQKCDILENRLHHAKVAMDGDVVMTGIASLLVIVAPVSWVTGTVAAGIVFLIAGDSGIQYLEALTRYQCGYFVPRVPLKRSQGFDEATAREYNAINNEFEFKQACLSQMDQLESTLDDARPVIHDVTTKLGGLADVRATISAGICIIQNSLSYAEDPSSQLFARRVQRLETVYGCLSRALRYYQVTVQLPESGAGLARGRARI